jgi:hypothetical protein
MSMSSLWGIQCSWSSSGISRCHLLVDHARSPLLISLAPSKSSSVLVKWHTN